MAEVAKFNNSNKNDVAKSADFFHIGANGTGYTGVIVPNDKLISDNTKILKAEETALDIVNFLNSRGIKSEFNQTKAIAITYGDPAATMLALVEAGYITDQRSVDKFVDYLVKAKPDFAESEYVAKLKNPAIELSY